MVVPPVALVVLPVAASVLSTGTLPPARRAFSSIPHQRTRLVVDGDGGERVIVVRVDGG